MDGSNGTPELIQPNPTGGIELGSVAPEATPSNVEAAPAAGAATAAVPQPTLSAADVAAAIAAIPTPSAPGQQTQPTIPDVANDVDRIEPEWVHAAEDAIKQTAGSPYAEEEAIEDLQVDYMNKRYGKIIEKRPHV